MSQPTQEYSSHFALTGESVAPVKRCPKCQSVFITDFHCESCGLQFDLDRIEDPLGEKSYFAIKERMILKSSLFGFYVPWLEMVHKKEARSNYFYRLKALIEELCTHEDDFRESDTRRIYLLELGLLVGELVMLSKNEEKTKEDMHMLVYGPKKQAISQLIQHSFEKAWAQKQLQSRRSIWQKKFFGLLSLTFLVRIVALSLFSLFFALGVYRYLTLSP